MRSNLKAYKKVNVESGILASDPHMIILMMLDGALGAIAQTKGAFERKDFEAKSALISKAINIFSALRESLDKESQPQISQHFDDLYSYCIIRLGDLSVSMEPEGLDELIGLVKPLRDAWEQMPEDAKQEGINMLNEKNAAQAASHG